MKRAAKYNISEIVLNADELSKELMGFECDKVHHYLFVVSIYADDRKFKIILDQA